jgi:hypothetical protein
MAAQGGLGIGCWLLAVVLWLLAVGSCVLAIGCSKPPPDSASGCLLLSIGYWLLSIGYLRLRRGLRKPRRTRGWRRLLATRTHWRLAGGALAGWALAPRMGGAHQASHDRPRDTGARATRAHAHGVLLASGVHGMWIMRIQEGQC